MISKLVHIFKFFKNYSLTHHTTGQFGKSHTLCSTEFPEQLAPPWEGVGLSHTLVRFCVPLPQEPKQSLKSDQSLQPPSICNQIMGIQSFYCTYSRIIRNGINCVDGVNLQGTALNKICADSSLPRTQIYFPIQKQSKDTTSASLLKLQNQR